MYYLEQNYQEMIELTQLPKDFLKSSPFSVFIEQIIKDLSRSGFLETKNGNFMDFIFHWVSIKEHTIYTQGDMNADVFASMVNLIALSLEKFSKQTHLEMNELMMEYIPHKKTLTYSYFDDDKVLCGISLAYYLNDNNAWTAAIIRNTTATPQDKNVVVFCNECMLDIEDENSQYHVIDFNKGKNKFFDFLNCKQIKKDLASCFSKNGALKFGKLQTILDNKLSYVTPEIQELLGELYRGEEFSKTALGKEYLEEEPIKKNSFLEDLFCCFTAWKKPPIFRDIEPNEVIVIENKSFEEIDGIIDFITAPVEDFNEINSIIENIKQRNRDNIAEDFEENKKQLR